MPDTHTQVPNASSDDSQTSIINGLAGVVAAVATEEVLSHMPLKGAAGLVAASVGGLVVYGLDHTEFGQTIENTLLPTGSESSIMPDCLPSTNLIDATIELVSRPFETINSGDQFAEFRSPIVPIISGSEYDSVDNVVDSSPFELSTEVSAAQSIVDQLSHKGIVVCDPLPTESDALDSLMDSHTGVPRDLI